MYLLDDEDTIIPMEVRGALSMYQHWEPDENDISKLKKHFATAIGPWEPYKYYDGKPTMDIMGEEWMSFHTAQEEERKSDNDPKPLIDTPSQQNQVQCEPTNGSTSTLPVLHGRPSKTPNELFFINTLQEVGGDENPLLYMDAKEWLKPKERLGKAFHLSLDYTMFLQEPEIDHFLDMLDDGELLGHNEPFDTLAFAIHAKATILDAKSLQPYLAWQPLEVIR